MDALPPPPQCATLARKSARCGAGAGSPKPSPTAPGEHGRRALAARPQGRTAGRPKVTDTRYPSQGLEVTPPGTASHHPRGAQPSVRHARQRNSAGPPRPHTRARSTRAADPDCLPRGRLAGRGRAPDRPQTPLTTARGTPPPGDAPPPTPQRATPARKRERVLRGWCWAPTPTPPAPRKHGQQGLAARPQGWTTGRATTSHHPRGTQPPAGHARQRDCAGPPGMHTHAHSTWAADPDRLPGGRAAGGGRALDLRRPSHRREAPLPGTPSRQPHSAHAGSQERPLWDQC